MIKKKKNVSLTKEQEDAIVSLYPNRSNKEIAKELGLTEAKIAYMAAKLNLKKSPEYKHQLGMQRNATAVAFMKNAYAQRAIMREELRQELRAEVYEEVRQQVLIDLAEKQKCGELPKHFATMTTTNRQYREKILAQAFRSLQQRGELTPKTYTLVDAETGQSESFTLYKVAPGVKTITRQQAIELSESIHI